jgi:hypothetical protein
MSRDQLQAAQKSAEFRKEWGVSEVTDAIDPHF